MYLTENSINSSWVKQELDAAFVTELENKGGFLALYVDNDDSRNQLPLDLRSRRIPAINEENFSENLLELVALAWETFSKKQVNRVQDKTRIGMLELEKQVLEKELEIEKLKSETKVDYSEIIQTLSEKQCSNDRGESTSLDKLFYSQRDLFIKSPSLSDFYSDFGYHSQIELDVLLTILVLQNLVHVTVGDIILTDIGKKVLNELEKIYGSDLEK